jgi:hypothetical protein
MKVSYGAGAMFSGQLSCRLMVLASFGFAGWRLTLMVSPLALASFFNRAFSLTRRMNSSLLRLWRTCYHGLLVLAFLWKWKICANLDANVDALLDVAVADLSVHNHTDSGLSDVLRYLSAFIVHAPNHASPLRRQRQSCHGRPDQDLAIAQYSPEPTASLLTLYGRPF